MFLIRTEDFDLLELKKAAEILDVRARLPTASEESENLRARRAYEGAGFRAEGISRGSAYFQGIHRDELIMSILRPEWALIQSAG